jgi:hypothetical protein
VLAPDRDHSGIKCALRWVGTALAVAGVVFVVFRLHDEAAEIDVGRFDQFAFGVLAALAAVYGIANVLLALAWRNLLEFCGAKVERRWAIRAYGISQLAKYIPGNVFQFAGRQAMGMSAGLPGWPLAQSALWEIGLIVPTGAVLGLLALPLVVSAVPSGLVLILFAGLVVAGCVGLAGFIDQGVARAAAQYAAFFAISSLTFLGTLGLMYPEAIAPDVMLPLCGAYVLAWLAGFVMPGAPAGIGVRELVLLLLLTGLVSSPETSLSAVLVRIVTTVGDALFFAGAWLVKVPERSEA